jgi:hypothetical protein
VLVSAPHEHGAAERRPFVSAASSDGFRTGGGKLFRLGSRGQSCSFRGGWLEVVSSCEAAAWPLGLTRKPASRHGAPRDWVLGGYEESNDGKFRVATAGANAPIGACWRAGEGLEGVKESLACVTTGGSHILSVI